MVQINKVVVCHAGNVVHYNLIWVTVRIGLDARIV